VITQRNGIKKFVFGLAVASMLLALSVAGVTGWAVSSLGTDSVISASLFSTTLFFVSVGVVLYVMSKPPRPLDPPNS